MVDFNEKIKYEDLTGRPNRKKYTNVVLVNYKNERVKHRQNVQRLEYNWQTAKPIRVDNFTNLRALRLSNEHICGRVDISKLPHLIELRFTGKSKSPTNLVGYEGLRILQVGGNCTTEFDFSHMANLEELYFSWYRKTIDITPLISLRVLDADWEMSGRVIGLENKVSLSELRLNRHPFKVDISALVNLKRLELRDAFDIGNGVFPALTYLDISSQFTGKVNWDMFPALSRVDSSAWTFRQEIPAGVKGFTRM